ncbi:MAG TPA: DEAD/DEAH box helicase, partial [Gaiellaceae bacterium]|nr:DEAD/DEAH box helicase [Gaiellaceae bacterium]
MGWRTTDADEIALRRQRAASEPMRIETLEPSEPIYSTFAVKPPSGACYEVEVRSLSGRENSCSCPDFRTNGLATCKHVEAVTARLRRTPAGRSALKHGGRSTRVELFMRRTGGEPEVVSVLPERRLPAAVAEILSRYVDRDGRLQGDLAEALPALVRDLDRHPAAVRISKEVVLWAAGRARRAARAAERLNVADELRSGSRSLAALKLPLYPYQIDGMLHLAFTERALLGDEMGLGKTAQAVAACALLRELRGVARVLVVCPVSLKTEWEEQITKFTDLPFLFVQGTKPDRLACYETPAFFTIANYEQVIRDAADVNQRLRPDVVILDEAQRIKNWNTQTARAIKRLESRYAFLLTGTPIENRIDEIYSIIDYIDPQVFGPLFRFNRTFYELDERGRPVGYRNLDELQRRLRPLLLRRRKDQIEAQLPERVDNNYFVPMSAAQLELYAEYENRVARLLAVAKKRPLTREEQEKLQRWLACMRMLCDTAYILTPNNRECPKIHELEAVLEDLGVRRSQKAIVFSEWERMLELARALAGEMRLGFAWHTGSVPQAKRREEIRRFKSDPGCRLFLSTDSGGLGLNLQAASVVVNLDLPWNPARLEQRIARAWRKHQTRSVHVVNLISEGTIEHRMVATLAAKQQLADGILDARGDLAEVRMPTAAGGRFLDRLRVLMESTVRPAAAPPPPPPPSLVERLRAHLADEIAPRVVDVRVLTTDAHTAAVVIVDHLGTEVESAIAARWPELATSASLPAGVEIVDAATWEVVQRLARRGVLPALAVPSEPDTSPESEERHRRRAEELLRGAERKREMSRVLCAGGFAS